MKYFCDYCNREIETDIKDKVIKCSICKKEMKLVEELPIKEEIYYPEPPHAEFKGKMGYVSVKKSKGYVTPIHKVNPRPKRITEIPKLPNGSPDLLAMQNFRERTKGIPKQTADERQMQRVLKDSFQ